MRFISYFDSKNKAFNAARMISETRFVKLEGDIIDEIKNFDCSNIDEGNFQESSFEKISNINLASPIPIPNSLRDAYSFRQHVEISRKNRGMEMIPEFDNFPVYYYSNHNSVIGPGEVFINRKLSEMLDYELEIAAIIGKKGVNIPASKADEYIFGFTIMNDFSSRKIQANEMKLNLGPAKGKDFATALGPFISTIDEFEDRIESSSNGNIYNIELKGYLNGDLISQDNLRNMSWTFAQIIERISTGTTIYPGDVIGSGTCATGCLYELNSYPNSSDRWLKDEDVIEINAESLGTLKNTIKII